MNLFSLLNRAPKGKPAPEFTPREMRAIERERAGCINALLVDETRAWLDLGDDQPDVLRGICAMLLFAFAVKQHDDKSTASSECRVMRGALNAAAKRAETGAAVITPDEATAMSIAATKARAIIADGSPAAIVYAARRLKQAYAESGNPWPEKGAA